MKLFKKLSMAVSLVILMSVLSDAKSQEKMAASDSLSSKQQSLIAVAATAAKGDLSGLKLALNKSLTDGLTINELKESLIHLYAYCGFPRSLRGLQTLMAVLDERKAKGIHDKPGKGVSPIGGGQSKYERGKATLEKLTGVKESGPKIGYATFAPEIEIFLKEHLFADLFERDVLTYLEREVVTISVLSSIGGVEPMLRSHLNICLNLGLTPIQLQHFVNIVGTTTGKLEAKASQKVLEEILKNKN